MTPARQQPYDMQDAYILTKEKWIELCEHLTIGCTNQKAFLDSLEPVHTSAPAPANCLAIPCPVCHAWTFRANIDEGYQILCSSCGWKQAIVASATAPKKISVCGIFGDIDRCQKPEVKKSCLLYEYCLKYYRHTEELLIQRAESAKAERERVLQEIYLLAEDMILDGQRMIQEEPMGKLYGKGKVSTASVFQMRIESLRAQQEPQQ